MQTFTAGLAVGAAILLSVTALGASQADARTRHASAQIHTPRGAATAERTTTRHRGERARTTTVSGPNGKTTTATDIRTRDRAAETASHERDRTFADGSTRSVDSNLQRTGEGTYDASRTVTGRDGEARTQTGTIVVTKTP